MATRSVTHIRVASSRRGERAVSPPAPLFKPDAAKRIDRHIDYFGGERATADVGAWVTATRRERP